MTVHAAMTLGINYANPVPGTSPPEPQIWETIHRSERGERHEKVFLHFSPLRGSTRSSRGESLPGVKRFVYFKITKRVIETATQFPGSGGLLLDPHDAQHQGSRRLASSVSSTTPSKMAPRSNRRLISEHMPVSENVFNT